MPLTPQQKRHLRSLGHHLSPIVQVGHEGVTEGVAAALSQALADHELVKVKFAQLIADRPEAAGDLSTRTTSECAQILGRTALFYLRHPKKPKIDLPGLPPIIKERVLSKDEIVPKRVVKSNVKESARRPARSPTEKPRTWKRSRD